MGISNGKGSKQRPLSVSREIFNKNWDRIFHNGNIYQIWCRWKNGKEELLDSVNTEMKATYTFQEFYKTHKQDLLSLCVLLKTENLKLREIIL